MSSWSFPICKTFFFNFFYPPNIFPFLWIFLTSAQHDCTAATRRKIFFFFVGWMVYNCVKFYFVQFLYFLQFYFLLDVCTSLQTSLVITLQKSFVRWIPVLKGTDISFRLFKPTIVEQFHVTKLLRKKKKPWIKKNFLSFVLLFGEFIF